MTSNRNSGLLMMFTGRLKAAGPMWSPSAKRWTATWLKLLDRRVRAGRLTRAEALRLVSAIAAAGSRRVAGRAFTLTQVRAAIAGASVTPARKRTPSVRVVKRSPRFSRVRNVGSAVTKAGPAKKAARKKAMPLAKKATPLAKKAKPRPALTSRPPLTPRVTVGQRAKPPEVRMEGRMSDVATAPDDAVKMSVEEAGEMALGNGGDKGSADPPRSCFPLLKSDSVVVSGAVFPLAVGLSARQSTGVVGDSLVRPKTSVGNYVMTIQVVATGFTTAAGESLRRDLRVTAKAPYPTFTLHLTADAQSDPVVPRAVQAIYSIDSQTIGMAVRAISVVKDKALLAQTPQPKVEANRDLRVPVGGRACDVEVRILLDRAVTGQLSWSLQTRFSDIHVPDVPPLTNIGGEDPKKFSRDLMNGVNDREGQAKAALYLRGVGKTIASKMPADFWRIFHESASRAGGPPTLLILSEEPHVPWELAFVGDPLPDPSAPPFLAAQAVLGRWPLTAPVQPPPADVDVSAVAVISGVYDQPGWARLEAAEDEAATLINKRFGTSVATKVDATSTEVTDYLAGAPLADLLHFSVHGSFDPSGVADGLVMTDGKYLDPMDVRGADLPRHPFVFLNACQVGQGNQTLGDYAGMAEAFLFAGSSGVIAPLWSIDDKVARELALSFYASTVTPAEYLRTVRAQFRMVSTPQSATYLAYQFFGHPALRVHLPSAPVATPVQPGGNP